MNEEPTHVIAEGPRSVAAGGDVVDSIINTGDNNTITLIINKYTVGVADLPTDYASRIENFFTEYLGTSEHPVPFGGREMYLSQLDAWLEHSITPYLLLTAPAGRGKSALLVHWSQRLAARDDLSVAFIPVSIRFRTNLTGVFFVALVARLASLHGEKVPTNLDTSPEVWRGLMSDYLKRPLPDGRHLLLILDGWDEADWQIGPDLFPLAPPAGLRIVLSARYLVGDTDAKAWLGRLGWDLTGLATSVELDPLTPEGIADLFRQVNFPRIGSDQVQAAIVTELYRLSEGDPLLVGLYVKALQSSESIGTHLQSEELSTIRPGLEGYFHRWWEEQRQLWGNQRPLREPAVQALLNILACALGPLSSKDILCLVPQESGLNSWSLEDFLDPLKRFVVGDGKEAGYTFSHPRLGYYFYDLLTENERSAVEERFLAWGKGTLAAWSKEQLPTEQASSYIVQYYRAHIKRANCGTSEILSLVSNGWRLAWEALEGTDAGFLIDTTSAWRAAERDNECAVKGGQMPTYLGDEVNCALCVASVNSLATYIPIALLIALVEKGIWSAQQALAHARQIQAPKLHTEVLIALSPYVQSALREKVLREALQTIWVLDDNDLEGAYYGDSHLLFRKDLLEKLAPELPRLLDYETVRRAIEVIQRSKGDRIRARKLELLAPFIPADLSPFALEIARSIQDDGELRAAALAVVLPHIDEGQRDALAQEALTALMLRSQPENAWALKYLAPYLSRDLLLQTLNAARATYSKESRAQILLALLLYLPKEIKVTVLIEAVKTEPGPALFSSLSENQLMEGLRLARLIQDPGWQAIILTYLLPYLSEESKKTVIPEALAIALTIINGSNQYEDEVKERVLLALLPYSPHTMISQTLETARTLKDEWSKTELLIALLPYLTEETRKTVVQEVLAAVLPGNDLLSKFPSSHSMTDFVDLLNKVLAYIPQEEIDQVTQKALAIARSLEAEPKAEYIAVLLPYLSNEMKETAGRELLAATWTIRDQGVQERVLQKAVSSLPESLIQEALVTEKGSEKKRRAEILSEVASSLSDPLLREVLAAMRTIEDEQEQAIALVALLPYQPQLTLQAILERVQALKDESHIVQALLELASRLPEPLRLNLALEALVRIPAIAEDQQVKFLKMLVPFLPETLVQDALEIIQQIKDISKRDDVLIALTPYVPDSSLGQVLGMVWMTEDETEEVRLMKALAPRLPEALLGETFEHARQMKVISSQSNMLRALAPRLPENLRLEALNIVEAMHDSKELLRMQIALASFEDEAVLNTVLNAVLTSTRPYKVDMLQELAPSLSERLLEEALKMVKALKDDESKMAILKILASYLPASLLEMALDAVRTIEHEGWRGVVLAVLVPHVSTQLQRALVREALTLLGSIRDQDPWGYADDAWAALAPILPRVLNHEELQEVLEVAGSIINYDVRLNAMGKLALYLPAKLNSRALEGALDAVEEERLDARRNIRPDWLRDMIPSLPEALLDEVIDIISNMVDQGDQAEILAPLVLHVPESRLPDLLEPVQLSDDGLRGWVLQKLALALTKLPPSKIYALWRQLLHFSAKRTRQSLLMDVTALAPIIHVTGGTEAIEKISNAISEVGGWWP